MSQGLKGEGVVNSPKEMCSVAEANSKHMSREEAGGSVISSSKKVAIKDGGCRSSRAVVIPKKRRVIRVNGRPQNPALTRPLVRGQAVFVHKGQAKDELAVLWQQYVTTMW